MRTLTRTLLILLLVLIPTTSVAGDDCETDPNKFWLCAGDVAWVSGYLIAPDVFDLRKCEVWEQKAKLLPQVQTERDEYKQQRDDALTELELQRDRAKTLETEYDQCALDYNNCAHLLVETEAQLNESYSVLEVALIGGGTGLVAIAAGLLIGALAM